MSQTTLTQSTWLYPVSHISIQYSDFVGILNVSLDLSAAVLMLPRKYWAVAREEFVGDTPVCRNYNQAPWNYISVFRNYTPETGNHDISFYK